MSEWVEKNLDEVYDFKSGLSKSRDQFGFGNGFVSFKDVFYNFFLPDTLNELANTTEKEQESCSVKRGDVFLTRTSETFDELGMSSVALKNYEKATFNGFTKRLRPIECDVNIWPEYIGYYFRSSYFRKLVTSMSTMTTRASLNNEILSKLKVKYPPLPEQKAIAHVLGKLDDKIELNRQMNQTLEEMAHALFKSWFVDFDPVLDNAIAAGNEIPEALQAMAEKRTLVPDEQKLLSKNPELASQFPSSFEYKETLGKWIPEGWEVKTIDDASTLVGGGTPSTKVEEYFTENGIPWLSPKDLSGYNWKYISRGATDITELGLQKSSAKLMPKGSVLFSSRAPIGYIAIAENEICTNQGFKSLVPNKGVPTEYLFQFLKSNTEKIDSVASGSTFKEVSGSALKGLEILVPEERIMKLYSKKVEATNQKSLINQKQTETLTQLRDTLLPQLISGKVRVPEEVVERFGIEMAGQ